MASSHNELILDQFTRQAVPFSTAPGIRDEEALARLVDWSGAGADDTVLDVACGPGLVVAAFARVARHVTGIDLTPAMIERGRAIQRERGLANVTLTVGDVLPLPYPDGAFTIVVSRFAVHHFLEPVAVLREMARVCAPGGRVLVVDVMASPDPVVAAAYDRVQTLRDASHVRALTLAELEALFPAAGMAAPRVASYRLAEELESLLARSFPAPGDVAVIRRMFEESLEGDGLGLSTRRQDGAIHFEYPIAMLAADR